MRETNRARQAFEDYYNTGPGRSLRILFERYQNEIEQGSPTRRMTTLREWSVAHHWQDRIAQRDTEIAIAQFEAIKSRAIEAGYAYWPKRVEDLVALAELLLEEIHTENKRWLPDFKQIGSGYSAKTFSIVRFNSPLIDQFRRTLDDIAKEMGERVKGLALSGPDGGPIAIDFGAGARDTLLGRLLQTSSLGDEGEAAEESDR